MVGCERRHLTIEDLTRWIGAPRDAGGLEMRAARLADLASMDGFTARQHVHTLRTWLAPRYFFFVALADGRPICYRCPSTTVAVTVATAIRLAPHQLFVVDEYTVPEFRRRGITRQLAIAMNPALRARGFREVVGVHAIDNEHTIAATRAKGIRTIGTLTRWRAGWRTWFTYEPREATGRAPLSPALRRRTTAPHVLAEIDEDTARVA